MSELPIVAISATTHIEKDRRRVRVNEGYVRAIESAALIHAARERGIPLLGICRGCQVMNVAMGGTLVQDLPSALGSRSGALDHGQKHGLRDKRVHEIRLESGSRLAQSIGAERFSANS